MVESATKIYGEINAVLFSIRKSTTTEPNKNDIWILKPNTKYVISITTYAAVYATMKIDWFEHTDKD